MAAPNSFDQLIADLDQGLDLLAERRRHPSAGAGFTKAWGVRETSLAEDGAEIARSIAASRGRTAATRRLAAEIKKMTATVSATSVLTREVAAAAKRDRLRAGVAGVLSKAMSLFGEGKISGAEVRSIEARALRIGQALSL